MTISVRLYAPPDFDEANAVINAAIEADNTRRINAEGLQHGLDEGLIGSAVAVNNDHAVIGLITWEPLDQGYFLQGWVHPTWRGQGAGSALLRATEDNLARRLKKRTGGIARVYEDIPNVESLFRDQGYDEVRRFYNMSVSLRERSFDVQVPSGITLKPFEPETLAALVAADNEFFADHWGALPRSVRDWTHQLIDARPHDPELWIIAWENGTIVGECLCHASQQGGPNDGWVAIVGIKKQWRGRGLGRAILSCGLQGLQLAGYETASLHVDAENAPAVRLYRSLGMEIARTRIHFRKPFIPVRSR